TGPWLSTPPSTARAASSGAAVRSSSRNSSGSVVYRLTPRTRPPTVRSARRARRRRPHGPRPPTGPGSRRRSGRPAGDGGCRACRPPPGATGRGPRGRRGSRADDRRSRTWLSPYPRGQPVPDLAEPAPLLGLRGARRAAARVTGGDGARHGEHLADLGGQRRVDRRQLVVGQLLEVHAARLGHPDALPGGLVG